MAQRLSHRVILWRVTATPLQTPLVGPSPCSIPAWQEHLPLRSNLVEHAGFLVLGSISLVFILQHSSIHIVLGTVPIFVDLIDDYS
jgi:hypothetical protein